MAGQPILVNGVPCSGGSCGQAAGRTSTLVFTYNDPVNGSNNIAWGQAWLADSAGNPHCNLLWAPNGALKLYAEGSNSQLTAATSLNTTLSNTFCSVSVTQVSFVSSTSFSITLNMSFTSGVAGTYNVVSDVLDLDGDASPPGALGTFNPGFVLGPVTPSPVTVSAGSTAPITVVVNLNGSSANALSDALDFGSSSCSNFSGDSFSALSDVSVSQNDLYSSLVAPVGIPSGPYSCVIGTYLSGLAYQFQITILAQVLPAAAISGGGTPISGNSASNPVAVSVGDPIALTTAVANLPAGVTITSQSWSVTGTRVMNYTNLNTTQALTNATVTNFADPGTSGITFYWTDSDNVTNYSVTYTATLSSQTPISAVALFHVARPTPISFSGTPSTMTPVVNAGNIQEFGPTTPSLNFGYNPEINNGSPGITYNVSVGTGNGGSAALLQLINVANSYVLASGATQRQTSNGYVLDAIPQSTIPMYSNIVTPLRAGTSGWMLNDQPVIGLSAGLTSVSANEQFMTYLMYQPPTPGAIWVTLAVMNWNWYGTTTLNAGVWAQATATGFSANPSGANSNVQPQWNSNVLSVPIQ